MQPSEIYKLFGPISVAVTWLTVAFLIYHWRGDKSMSISRHAAAHKSAYVMMLVVESIVLPMFFLFVAKWLVPTLELPAFFTVCIGLASFGLLLAAYVPDTKGWMSTTHGLASYGAALLFIPATTILYLSPNISSFAQYFALLVLIYEIASVTLFTVLEKAKEHHLYVQAAYIFLFDISLLAAAFII